MSPQQPKVRLPRIANDFLRTKVGWGAAFLVQQLHRCMADDQRTFSQLNSSLVLQYVDKLLDRPQLGKRTKTGYRCQLLRYFDYLYVHGRISFDPALLRLNKHSKRQLPPAAEQFLQTLQPTRKRTTVSGYRSCLRKLYDWLANNNVTLSKLDRSAVTDFLQHLADQGLQAQSRILIIVNVRTYLRWQYERAVLKHHPDNLIRPSDLPKRPTYLPRPLPLEADRELQRRLKESDSRYQQGLLLMRKTGLRIGELISLDFDCLRSDPSARTFLKVPLGKLANERLVPLDDQTATLARRLQSAGSPNRRWLLETSRGKQVSYVCYRDALLEAGDGLHIDGRLTTHRLRHSYATTLLSGGMSLVGIMNLLGHRDYRMTLRYAAITLETVTREYFEALTKIEKKYQGEPRTMAASDHDPLLWLSDLARWIQKHIGHELGNKRAARALVKRVERIQAELQELTSGDPNT